MIPPCSKCQTTYKTILVTATETSAKIGKIAIGKIVDGKKIIHGVIPFSRFFKVENYSEKQVLLKRIKAAIKRCSLNRCSENSNKS